MKQYHTVIKNIYILFMGSINSPYSEAVAQHFKQRIERKREREREREERLTPVLLLRY